MRTFIILTALAVCALLMAGSAGAAMRKWGMRGLVAASASAACFLLLFGYLDYAAQSPIETPLRTYVLASVCSTSLAALVVWISGRRRARPALQTALGAIVWLASTLLITASTMFL